MKTVRVRIKFVKEDCWIGVFWKRKPWLGPGGHLLVYVCLVPCFPIVIERKRQP